MWASQIIPRPQRSPFPKRHDPLVTPGTPHSTPRESRDNRRQTLTPIKLVSSSALSEIRARISKSIGDSERRHMNVEHPHASCHYGATRAASSVVTDRLSKLMMPVLGFFGYPPAQPLQPKEPNTGTVVHIIPWSQVRVLAGPPIFPTGQSPMTAPGAMRPGDCDPLVGDSGRY